jgi:hypothetical protein
MPCREMHQFSTVCSPKWVEVGTDIRFCSLQSALPRVVPYCHVVECLAVGLPVGHEAVHQSDEAGATPDDTAATSLSPLHAPVAQTDVTKEIAVGSS